jgi:Predicted transcriptional regulators
MKIQELADRTGLSIHTIRYYEKEGLLDDRHVQRDHNNYRYYLDAVIERLRLIKKFQGIGCSLIETKEVLQDHDTNSRTNEQLIEWTLSKINEIERKKEEYDQMLVTLNFMLEYRRTLQKDPKKAQAMLDSYHTSEARA